MNIIRNIKLLVACPKNFVFSILTGSNQHIHIRPYDPAVGKVSQTLIKKLKKTCPRVEIFLIGSTGLKICGRGDIDLYVTAMPNEFHQLIKLMTPLVGLPQKIRSNFVEWKSTYHGYPVELVMISPTDPRFIEQIRLYNLLKSNKSYLKEYANLKQNSQHMSEKAYQLSRMEFFQKVLS